MVRTWADSSEVSQFCRVRHISIPVCDIKARAQYHRHARTWEHNPTLPSTDFFSRMLRLETVVQNSKSNNVINVPELGQLSRFCHVKIM
ncbi:hypothetical protein ACTXT7_003855 [Hymenolepis weldensis]